MYQHISFYIDLSWEDYFEETSSYLNDIYELVNLAYLHKAQVFYSDLQLKDFIKNCKELDENFSASIGNQLEIILKNAICITQNHYYLFDVIFAEQNSSIVPVSNYAISIIDYKEKPSLISVSKKINTCVLLGVKSDTIFERVELNVLKEKKLIISWLVNNGEARNFNLSPKHGENGIGHWKDASPLLCNKADAQMYLNTAIADFTESANLFFFDNERGAFIEFFYEGDNPQHQWHGFHITTEEWKRRVPVSIRKYYGKY